MKSERTFYVGAAAVLFIIEVMIALYIHDDFIRPYIGDMLVVILLYCFVRIVFPKGIRFLPLYIFLFAVVVECLQYFNWVKLLGLEHNTFFRILMGSVFDIKDICCYGIGSVLPGVFQAFKTRKAAESE